MAVEAPGDVGRIAAELDLSGVWAVDPLSGREGPADIVVPGRTARSGDLAGGLRRRRRRRARRRGRARLHRPARAPARARQRGRRDDRERARGGGPWRVHDGLRHAQHRPGARRAGRAGPDPRRGVRLRLAGRAARLRRGDCRAQGRAAGGARRARRRRCRGFLGRRRARSLATDPAQRHGLRRHGRAADRRPRRGRLRDRGRRGERRVRGDRSRAARLAGIGRGERRCPRPGDPRGCRARRPRRAAPPHAPVDGRRPGSRSAGQGGRAAGHVRRDAAPPRAERRMAGRCAALGMGRER